MVDLGSVNIAAGKENAKTVVDLGYVCINVVKLNVGNVEALLFVYMVEGKESAKIVVDLGSVNMVV